MTTPASGLMTERQRAVMERIDRRVPIKVIARDLKISETRVNQHIRALKDIYLAGSLSELVENYRIANGRDPLGEEGLSEPDVSQSPADCAEEVSEERIPAALLDGPNGTLMRVLAIVGIAIGIVVVVSLVVTASVALSATLEGGPAKIVESGSSAN